VKTGRDTLKRILSGQSLWPPPVVPFGLDPFGWHGERSSYDEVCAFALEKCVLLPKVHPIGNALNIREDQISIETTTDRDERGYLRNSRMTKGCVSLTMKEILTPDDASWKVAKRWIENDDELNVFIGWNLDQGFSPNPSAVEAKAEQVGEHGLPYVEMKDPFYTVCEMFPLDVFYMKLVTDRERVEKLIADATSRILQSLEILCDKARCPFLMRFVGAEMSVPPFLGREDFHRYEGPFYTGAAEVCRRYGIPAAFHCHGPVKEIMDGIWRMGYSIIEPFEPPPRGNVSLWEALASGRGGGAVMGGVDEVMLHTGSLREVTIAVSQCLEAARNSSTPYILSQSATPFYDPLDGITRDNLIQMIRLVINS